MGGAVRPWLSAALLAGFLLVAGAQLALVALAVLLVLEMLPGPLALQLGMPLSGATVGVMGYATWRALRTRRAEPAGVTVARDDAPALWRMVEECGAASGVRTPDRLTVVAEATVAYAERARLLGLLGGRRDLYLGLPLLLAWDDARLRAAVAHELAHASPGLSRWSPAAYRGRVAVGRLVPRISRRNPAGPLLRAYAELYRRLDAPVTRAQELRADRIAAEVAGAPAAVAVLHDRPAMAALQRIFYAEYVSPGWRTGHAPDDVFGGFLRMLAARADELTRLRTQEEPHGTWDTHPPRADRLAAIAEVPAGNPAADAPVTEAATDLVPDMPGLARALQAVAFPPRGRSVVGWDDFFGAARSVEMDREADAALGTLTRAAGSPVAHAGDILDLAADGRLRKVAETVFPEMPPDETAARIGDLVTLLLALAALRSGAARWRHSWTGTAELVAPDGSHLDLGALAELVADPATVATARERLTALGIDPAARASGASSPAARAEVVGGVVNLVVDGARTDLLIVDTGLFLVPGLPRSQNGTAKRRLARFAADELRTEAAPGSRFVPYAEVAGAVQTRRTPKSWDLSLRDGATLTVRTALDSDELPGGWEALDQAVAFLARTRSAA